MLPLDQDINILYAGGSGGCYFLYQLLLCDQHWAKLELPGPLVQTIVAGLTAQQQSQLRTTRKEFFRIWNPGGPSYPDYFADINQISDEIRSDFERAALQFPMNYEDFPGAWPQVLELAINYQWNIADPGQWKSTEITVNNEFPILEKEYRSYQYLPTRYKRAYLSCSNFDSWKMIPSTKIMLYTDIRSQYALCKFKNTGFMSDQSESELYKVTEVWDRRHMVHTSIIKEFEFADHIVYLQDFVNNQPQFLGPMNPAQIQLRQQWLSLHPPELLKTIGIQI